MRRWLPLALLLTAAGPVQLYSPDEQRAILSSAAQLIETRYVDPVRAKAIAAALRKPDRLWQVERTGSDFAAEATKRLREVSHDGHLGLSFSLSAIPAQESDAAIFTADFERWYGAGVNHGVRRIERLDGNIIVLELTAFPPPAMGGDVIAAAMNVAAQGDALILDLRRNGGGAETAALVMAYLVAPGSPLSGTYDRPTNRTTAGTTPVWVPGRRFGEKKPLYVLTSHNTFSAAEAVAYDLQALKRATIIGETTGGGAHPFEYRRVHPHFALDLPEGRSINPITGSNWQDVGVRPDVMVPAKDAMDNAVRLARAALKGRSEIVPDPR